MLHGVPAGSTEDSQCACIRQYPFCGCCYYYCCKVSCVVLSLFVASVRAGEEPRWDPELAVHLPPSLSSVTRRALRVNQTAMPLRSDAIGVSPPSSMTQKQDCNDLAVCVCNLPNRAVEGCANFPSDCYNRSPTWTRKG